MVTASLIGVHEVRELLRPTASTVSVHLGPRTGPDDDADRELALRRRAILRDLPAQGADGASVDAVADHFAATDEADQVIFARDGRIVLAHTASGAVLRDLAVFGAPPRAVPLLAWLQANPAYVRVTASSTDAEVISVPAGAADGMRHSCGGPNIYAIAPLVVEQLDLTRARVLVLGGDPSIIGLITGYLRRAGRTPAVVVLQDGRHDEPTTDRCRIADVLARYAQAETAERVAQVVAGLRPHGPTVAGVDRTLAALGNGLIRSLVLVDDPDDTRTAWWGGSLLCSGFRPGATLPDSSVRQGRLVDVAVRAALITRSEVRVLSPAEGAALPDGIGGLLRIR